MAAKKRDNKYFLDRIKLDHPKIYAEYVAGKFKTVADARRAAEMLSPRTRVHELKNAWKKASIAERREFAEWIKKISGLGTAKPRPATAAVVDGKLEHWAALRIEQIIRSRDLKMGEVMVEMGVTSGDGTLGKALHRGSGLRPLLAVAVERWLDNNKGVR